MIGQLNGCLVFLVPHTKRTGWKAHLTPTGDLSSMRPKVNDV
jgi:hypothetical protein